MTIIIIIIIIIVVIIIMILVKIPNHKIKRSLYVSYYKNHNKFFFSLIQINFYTIVLIILKSDNTNYHINSRGEKWTLSKYNLMNDAYYYNTPE